MVVVFSPDPHAPVLAGMPAVAIALIVSRGLAYGMAEPARHSLYTRMPRSVRYKGQNKVDTAVWRFGDVAIASGMNGLRTNGTANGGFANRRADAGQAGADTGRRLPGETENGGQREAGEPAPHQK